MYYCYCYYCCYYHYIIILSKISLPRNGILKNNAIPLEGSQLNHNQS